MTAGAGAGGGCVRRWEHLQGVFQGVDNNNVRPTQRLQQAAGGVEVFGHRLGKRKAHWSQRRGMMVRGVSALRMLPGRHCT